MEISIAPAGLNHLDDCLTALLKSKLGEEYFPTAEKGRLALTEGISRGEMFVALAADGECVGFIWFIENGAFHSFPYLHIIAVKETYRSRGIGKKLLAFFEGSAFSHCSKVFLVVADFNPEAKQLYEAWGYQQVGVIPDLYKKGVAEYLMMKEKK